jgi:hypothetical protein
MRPSILFAALIAFLPACATGGVDTDTTGGAATPTTTAGDSGHGGAAATTTTSTSTGAGGAATTTSTSTGAGGAATTTSTSTGSGGAATTTSTSTGSGGAATTASTSTGSGGAATTTSTSTGSGGAATTTSTTTSTSTSTSTSTTTSTSTGPVDIGVYAYAPIPTPGLINPPSAAWHPDGTYALVLNNADKVYRYDPGTKALAEVATVGSGVAWRVVSFTPDGTKAVLLGNVTTSGKEEGRVYIWDNETSTLSQMPDTTQPQITYEALAWSPDKTTARLLGAKKNGSTWLAYLWKFDPSLGLSEVKATATSAMCQDLAWATDAFDRPAIAVTCGGNGVTLFHVDFDGQIVNYNGNAGNTSCISARPQGDYALAVGWSGQRIYRFQQGGWNTDFNNPTLPGIYQVQFSSDGRRALVLGGFGKVYEYRHDLMDKQDFTDVSIPNFSSPPYNAESGVTLNDAAWRPGCDGGLLVGGANTWSVQKGYVIRFSVQNGAPCPN